MSAAQDLQTSAIAQANTYASRLDKFTDTLAGYANVSTGPRSSDGSTPYASWGTLLTLAPGYSGGGAAADGLTSLASKVATDIPQMASAPGMPSITTPEGKPIEGVIHAPTFQPVVAPTITEPDAPKLTALDPPSGRPTITAPALPPRPTITLPAAPNFEAIPLPIIDAIQLPRFEANAPAWDDLNMSVEGFSFAETPYTSVLLDELTSKVRADFDEGKYGIEEEIDEAEFSRLQTRVKEQQLIAETETMRDAAARGFTFPPGSAAQRLASTRVAMKAEISKAAVEFATKRMQMFREERKLTFERMERLIEHELKLYLAMSERALKVSQLVAEFGIKLYDAKVARFNAMSAGFRDAIALYNAQMQGELGRLEAQKVRMQSAEIAVNIQRNQAQVYSTQLEGTKIAAEIYAADVKATQSLLDIERLKLDAFRAEIEIFGEQIRGDTVKIQGYEAQLRGNATKAEVYKAMVSAQTVQADFARAQASIHESNARIEQENVRLGVAVAEAKANIYSAQARGVAASNEAWSRAYTARTDAFRAMSSVYESAGRLGIAQYEATSRTALGNLQAMVEQQKGIWDVRTKATTAGAEVLSRAMQSALNQVVAIAQTSE